jgi:hypothetical protein
VVLCRVTTTSCQIKSAWSATTSSAGRFEINGLPSGSYVLLYWSEIKRVHGLRMRDLVQ